MGKIQLAKLGFSAIRKCSNRKINPQELRLAIDSKVPAQVDEFVSTTTKKKLTPEDIFTFRQYLLGKEVDIKITQEEIKTLFACRTEEEFRVSAFELLAKKLKISDRLKPQCLYAPINPNAKMIYDYSENIIIVNTNAQIIDRTEFLVLLRHELQHYQQGICMLRHPKIGNEAVRLYAKTLANGQAKNIDNQARNCSIEELRSLGLPEDILQEFSMLKDLLSRNQTAEYEKYLQELIKELEIQNLKTIGDFRTAVVEELGFLQEGSREAGRAKKYFDQTASENGYFQNDGGIDYGKYVYDIRENEALVAQDMLNLRIRENHSCYPKLLNDDTQKLMAQDSGQNEVINDVQKYMEEQNAKGVSWRDILSYLFD